MSLTLTGAGLHRLPAGGGPSLTYQGNVATSVASAVATSSSASIGSAFATRRVIVIVSQWTVGRDISSATIGGVTADVIITNSSDGSNNNFGVISAIVPSGTTAVAVITFTTSIFTTPSTEWYTVDSSLLTNPTSRLARLLLPALASLPSVAQSTFWRAGSLFPI
jgi:hypothetical protein